MTLMGEGCAAPPGGLEIEVADDDLLECSHDAVSRLRGLDVALVVDTSMSTRRPSGIDIDGDGTVGSIRNNIMTDRHDTLLALQTDAARSLLAAAEGADVRFSLVTYAGPSAAPALRPDSRVVSNVQANIRAPLGSDRATLEAELDAIDARGGNGTTSFYAGMRRANRSLLEIQPTTTESDDRDEKAEGGEGDRGVEDTASERAAKRRRLMLFMSDSKGPVLRWPDGTSSEMDANVQLAAREAREYGITINSFAISEDAGLWRYETIGRIAGSTGGRFHMVEDPHALYCHLASALIFPNASL